MLHVLLRKHVVHVIEALVHEVLGAAADPEEFELLVQHRRIGFVPFGAIASAAERRDVRELVQFAGEVDEPGKQELLAGAAALIFPIEWPEPFGLVMIEAMACGTPTIAYRRGSIPEVIDDGETGFIVESIDDAVEATRRIPALSRARCRQAFEQRFTATRMAEQYVNVYERLVARAVNAGSEEWRA